MKQEKVLEEVKGESYHITDPERSLDLSVVIPISEHHDDLRELHLRCAEVLSSSGKTFEFIFVIDGPKHEAMRVLRELKKEHSEIKVITLNRSLTSNSL